MVMLLRSLFLIFVLSHPLFADLASDTVYLTWKRDPTTTMTIQWISLVDDKSNTIVFHPLHEEGWLQIEGKNISFPSSETYLIHQVELTRLKPDTDYLFKLASADQTYLFRTMPADHKRPIRFVEGGDMYQTKIDYVKETCRQAAKTNPDFALLGGDIAYAVGAPFIPFQKVDRWIDWIRAWHQTMITPEKRMIPVIAVIGNHDLPGHYNQPLSKAAAFSALFPRSTPQLFDALDFGSYLSLILLDSGHATPVRGAQADWLKETLRKRQAVTHVFAAYHVPAYPSVRKFKNPYSAAIRNEWVPIFENEGLHAAFEHHDHDYKRTKPLLRNKIDPTGVVYFGDGAWGLDKPRKPRARKIPYIAKSASRRHFLFITLYPDRYHLISLDSKGEKIDEFIRKS